MPRCAWVGEDPLYIAYHDEEWGIPERDPVKLFECLCLEGFQSGLSWITILRKREGFRDAFAGFDPSVLASWGEAEVARLVEDARIVRHRGKIEATIGNARAYLAMEEPFADFIWSFVDSTPLQPARKSITDVPAKAEVSETLSKALKKKGFKFCGPTTVYAFMQAVGMVNDHVVDCPQHDSLAG
ncbi:DNA-3-methyladenine glycosylase I [Aestuariibius sp. 2305UL40-4]|uniref:DNA-3-methyladenine glycosylase I n=1 Tax=Aestuariibius violaceus TaxID=3234132 RepID=UPI00345E294B